MFQTKTIGACGFEISALVLCACFGFRASDFELGVPMRRCYLVCYDIREAKRLRRVHRICKGFGEPWQFSVFFCVLRDIDRVRLQTALESEMNLKEDQTLLIDLGGDEEQAREAAAVIGKSRALPEPGMIVI
jgi:CRISPR-associated protein Cas2